MMQPTLIRMLHLLRQAGRLLQVGQMYMFSYSLHHPIIAQ